MQIPYRKPGKFSLVKQDPHITRAKFIELQNKLDKLKNYSRPVAAAEVSRLAELGDFSENAEYQHAKGKLRGTNSAILSIEIQLNNALIIELNPSDTVNIGNTVTIEIGDKRKKYQILGSTETSPERGIISHNSPIGSALLGHKVNDVFNVKIAGKEAVCRILKIE